MTPKKLVAALGLALASTGVQAAFDLTGLGHVQYGDALSYSMPFANYQATGDATPTPGDPYYVASSPGAIKSLTVVATGAGGQDVNTNYAGVDNAYSTPSGNNSVNFFQTGGLTIVQPGPDAVYPGTDPGQVAAFTNDFADTWDATIKALKDFLAGQQMIFFFNNNQLNRDKFEQSLAVWAQAWITDAAGNVVDPDGLGPQTGYYELTNNNSLYALVTEGGGGVVNGNPANFTSAGRTAPTGNANTNVTDYVLSGGELCAASSLGGALVACTDPLADIGPVNHNLGANNAAYAVVVPELNAQITGLIASLSDAALNDYTLHIDLRMGCDPRLFGTNENADICDGGGTTWGKNLNNGYEQVFITTAENVTNVPEPRTLALLGAALIGLAFSRGLRRRSIGV